MALRVLKFGGTSVGSPAKILLVAHRIAELHATGEQVLAVVSAMGQTTDELTSLARGITDTPPRREMDMLLTAGERISMALLAMALTTLDCPAISFTGSQSGIITDSQHRDARILAVRPFRIEEELAKGKVVIVAGFQGVSESKEITTLGRGGSDTTAVAMAIRLGAAASEIHTDVASVMSADPRIVPEAHSIAQIGFDAMIVLSHLGGRVMFWRALRLARRFSHPVVVRAAHEESAGTRIGESGGAAGTKHDPPELTALESAPSQKETNPMESSRLLAVAVENPVTFVRTDWDTNSTPWLPEALQRRTCLIHRQYRLDESTVRVEWYLSREEGQESLVAESLYEGTKQAVPRNVTSDESQALISLVGDAANLGSELAGVVGKCLRAEDVPILALHSGAHALSVLVPKEKAETACRLLHAELLGASGLS